jgi:ribosomal-protein-alanine N-acetyltransferase
MNQPGLPFRIQPMTLADIPEVVAVEQASYSMTWPAKAYDHELQKNELAHYFVLRVASQLTIKPFAKPANHQPPREANQPPLIGLGGFWLIADEIHVSTVAIHPDWRGLGLGEWMLTKLLEEGLALGARVATLEVRPSNRAARSLYEKYSFQEVGRRRRYYTDNGEDALILTSPPLSLPDYQEMFEQHRAALYRRLARIKIDRLEQSG